MKIDLWIEHLGSNTKYNQRKKKNVNDTSSGAWVIASFAKHSQIAWNWTKKKVRIFPSSQGEREISILN